MSDVIRIDVWSDIACPWCYIGKRRLEQGIEAFRERHPDARVEVEYHSFELAPDTPVDFEGSEVDFLVDYKGMPPEEVRAMLDRVTAIAAETGLEYDFDALQHTNTVKAHQLLHLAKAHGLQHEAKERLMRAYFTEGRHVGRAEDLADLAAEIGLDRDEALRALEADEYLDAVRADQELARRYRITAVPYYVINDRYGVAGAHPAEAFAAALERVLAEQSDAAA